jgi:hypothetical protein
MYTIKFTDMKTKMGFITALLFAIVSFKGCSGGKTHPVYIGKEMSFGYDLGVITDKGTLGWLSDSLGYMKLEYPAEQIWGSVFITVGKIKDFPAKPVVDLTSYKKISFELKGLIDNQKVEIGMKDAEDAEDGLETRIPLSITKEWKTYEIDLSEFKSADLKNIYILMEIVFNGPTPQTAYFRNIQYK